jgi:hypothetical protein
VRTTSNMAHAKNLNEYSMTRPAELLLFEFLESEEKQY